MASVASIMVLPAAMPRVHGGPSWFAVSRANLEFLHLALTAKSKLTTALARLRERGDREAVGEGFAGFARRKQPLTPGFAVPSPPGEGCYPLPSRRESKCTNSRARAFRSAIQ